MRDTEDFMNEFMDTIHKMRLLGDDTSDYDLAEKAYYEAKKVVAIVNPIEVEAPKRISLRKDSVYDKTTSNRKNT
ncbi:MAG: hypothetical protein IJ565_00930 [Bacilli bacterium]|nr:hypothetical protein [Bacilli bacterium]